MAFTGQILRWDQDAYWGSGSARRSRAACRSWAGQLVQILLGGPIIAGETLTRFFALHVFVIPGASDRPRRLHLLMVLKLGVNEWPMPGRLVERETYEGYPQLVTKTACRSCPWRFGRTSSSRAHHAGRRSRAPSVRALRSERRAGSDDHPDGAEAGLLLPLDLLGRGADAPVDGDVRPARRAGLGILVAAGAAVPGRARARRAGAGARWPC